LVETTHTRKRTGNDPGGIGKLRETLAKAEPTVVPAVDGELVRKAGHHWRAKTGADPSSAIECPIGDLVLASMSTTNVHADTAAELLVRGSRAEWAVGRRRGADATRSANV
jgi:hypothetical protein